MLQLELEFMYVSLFFVGVIGYMYKCVCVFGELYFKMILVSWRVIAVLQLKWGEISVGDGLIESVNSYKNVVFVID